jgi:hypothetical protein
VEDGETAKLFNPLGTTIVNPEEGSSPTLRVEFTKVHRLLVDMMICMVSLVLK